MGLLFIVVSFAIEFEGGFFVVRSCSQNAGATGGKGQHPCAKKCNQDLKVFFSEAQVQPYDCYDHGLGHVRQGQDSHTRPFDFNET